MISRVVTITLLASLLWSCTGKKLQSDNFDAKAWKEDPNGCNGKRFGMLEGLREAEDQLAFLTENEIKATLGSPDRKELFERGQKFYIYFVEPGSQCQNIEAGNDAETGDYIEVRFSAMNQVTEIAIQQGRKPTRD